MNGIMNENEKSARESRQFIAKYSSACCEGRYPSHATRSERDALKEAKKLPGDFAGVIFTKKRMVASGDGHGLVGPYYPRATAMKREDVMNVFQNCEAKYTDWLDRHPDGFVLSLRSRGNPSFLHRVGCKHLYETDPTRERTVNAKVCADSAAELVQWARADDRQITMCRSCHPEDT